MSLRKKPLIGITLDSENGGGYSVMPWYAIRQNYCDSIAAAGGIPFPLPHQIQFITEYADTIDGLVLTGGNFDVPPHLFGEKTPHETVKTKPSRTVFEYDLIKEMLNRDKPVLGICGGMQLINVALGGTLIQHIPDEVEDCVPHEQKNPRTQHGHYISIVEKTLLHKIVQETTASVNTAHHQAVKKIAPGLVVNAWAEDGVIEGIESQKHSYCLGVQWHPEYHVGIADPLIFTHFIDVCSKKFQPKC